MSGKQKQKGRIEEKSDLEDVTQPSGEARKKKCYVHFIFRDWCKACGICIAFCPRGVLARNEKGEPCVVHPERCIGCRFCELHCPDFAITVTEDPGTGQVGDDNHEL